MRVSNYFFKGVFLILLFFYCASTVYGQKATSDFKNRWKQIDSLVDKGLPKSALSAVDKIYTLSKSQKNDPQIIKALLYKIKLQQNIEEDADVKSIDRIESEIANAKEPARSIMESIAAQLYWNYFQQNRYKIYNRTKTSGFNKKDIATWTADDLHSKIGDLYLASVNDKDILKRQKLETFDAIIIKGNTRYLRPTLYDLLAHRALDYFKSDERDINRPSYYFEIKDKEVFAPAKVFIHHKFITKDSTSLHQKALLIFQELLAFHLNDTKPEAFIDADIERINFAYQYGVMTDKDTLYMTALKNISEKYKDNPASAQAAFLSAQTIYNYAIQSSDYSSKINSHPVNDAKEILDSIVSKYPASEGGINAKNLLTQLLHAEINLTTEKVNVPNVPFRTLVTYKNFSHIYFRLIPLTQQLKNQVRGNVSNDQIFQRLENLQTLRTWKQDFPNTSDYLSHSVEVKIDALPVGEYVLLGSAAPDFSLNKNSLAAAYFFVSNISFINSGQQYFVLDRTSGQPLDGANVQVFNQQYNYSNQNYQLQKQETIRADKNGYFKLPALKKNENRNVRFDISYKNDRLFLDDLQYAYNYNNDQVINYDDQKEYDEDNAKVFLFTDRSIYRPGQLIYFKGIGITKNWKTKKTILLQSKDSIKVFLNDANGQRVDSFNVLLNEYGSFNGKFRLPENKLNGTFEIAVDTYDNSSVSFSVEEYKRPKFYADFRKLKGSYRLGDTVSITGFAKAYSGNNIDGAKVSYRVTRQARFLYPWIFWREILPRQNPVEISNGEMTTGADGKFIIKFAAIPDLSIDKTTEPVFDYKVEADVTDINGETRSGDIVVPIGYKTLNLQIDLPGGDVVNVDSLKNIIVTSKNLSDQQETVNAVIKIYRLQPPQRLIRQRLWEKPDQFILTKSEFIQYFPNDEYAEESKKETWPKGELVYEKSDSTNHSKFQIQHSKLTQGWYVIEATAKDSAGQEVKNIKYFQAYNAESDSLPTPSYVWNTNLNNIADPGQTVHFVTGTSAKNVFLIEEINRQNSIDKKESTNETSKQLNFISLNHSKKSFDFNITENDRGGFGVNQFFVKDNRFYVSSHTIAVPWSNKELNISFDTYRDKTLPGSEEKWKVKISGNKGEKVAAEMLASMYDASLDQFKPHSWSTPGIWPTYSGGNTWIANQNFTFVQSFQKYWNEPIIQQKEKVYDALVFNDNNRNFITRKNGISNGIQGAAPGVIARKSNLDEVVVIGYGAKKEDLSGSLATVRFTPSSIVGDKEMIKSPIVTAIDQSQIQIRKNFNETVFFFPDLRTDTSGNIEFSFTMPEALTQWKLMTLAHTKDLAMGYAIKTVITQKDLMVQPNAPRFLREGDQVEFSAKIVNLGDKDVSGQADFQLLNATTMNPVDSWFKNNAPSKTFKVATGESALVTFNITVPQNFNDAVVYRIVAKAGNLSDGEEAAIPVVTNRMLVTETMPLPMRGNGTKEFKFEKLINSGKSNTLTNYGLTVEYTTNPAWYAIQALPYLMEYPYECAEQTLNRYYANAIATKIVNSSPKIKAVFEKWKTTDTAALMSNLQKNEELKSVLLQETPWVLQVQNEEQQKKNIALLFDMVKMSLQLKSTLDKLTDMQAPNGGFVWFKGGPDNRYMTQYIVTGIGHLKKLNALPSFQLNDLKIILDRAIPYLDQMLKKDYDDLKKHHSELKNNNLSGIAIQYLYMRSFFSDYPIVKETQTAFNYYREQSKKYWLSQSKYMQAMIALSLSRTNDNKTALEIIKSLKENSINNEELGMYWKEWNNGGYWWYQAPIESQAMMIEAFSEIEKDSKTIDNLKTWLLKNKQTNNWNTTKATAEACYALLLQGTDWLSEEKIATIKLGSITVSSKDEKQQAGTGYFKRKIDGDKVKPEMGNISVDISSSINQPANKSGDPSSSWGSIYWQYFENLDKITFSETPLKLSKKIFIEKNSDRGPVLQPVNDGDVIHVGDKVKIRIELRVDRDMEYVHMKDMRASCMEPTNVISQYKYQDGLGYYETTKDVSTNFFFGYLNKGTYVFEYPMFVTHNGNFSNGITTIQCMYAPEFTAHSEGVRISVK
jgi:uncharacterized protein YfaS (alpha-2-macroglobulin family)